MTATPAASSRRGPLRSLVSVGTASAGAAVLGLVTLIAMGRLLGPGRFGDFSVIWGAYFAFSGLLFALQQELTRAVSVRTASAENTIVEPPRTRRVAPLGAAVVAALAAGLLALSAPWWLFQDGAHGTGLTLVVLVVGMLALGWQSLLIGTAAGNNLFGLVSAMVVLAALTRLAALVVAASTGDLTTALAVGVVSGSFVFLPMLASRRIRHLMFPELPGTVSGFVAGTAGLMVANACAAALATGIPFLIQLTARGELPDRAGVVFAALIVTRTPLLLPINGYQLLLIRYLTTHRQQLAAALPKLAILAGATTVVVMAVAFVAGPTVLRLVFGSDFDIAHRTMAGLACGAVALAALTITGAVTIAASRQVLCAAGWVAATLVTASVLAFDASLEARVVVAVIVGPVCGCAVHLVGARSYYRGSTA